MQKTKPIEYIQAILYHIKYHWRVIVTSILAIATIILGLLWSSTQEQMYYYVGVGTGLAAVLIACVVYAPVITQAMDKLGLRLAPEDEKEKATSDGNH